MVSRSEKLRECLIHLYQMTASLFSRISRQIHQFFSGETIHPRTYFAVLFSLLAHALSRTHSVSYNAPTGMNEK